MVQKTLVIVMFIFCYGVLVHAQNIDNEKAYYQYAHVAFDKVGFMATKYSILLQEGGSENDLKLMKDEHGNKLQFPTWIDAMNYLSLQGWEIVEHKSGVKISMMWIIRKKVTKSELQAIVDNTSIKQEK